MACIVMAYVDMAYIVMAYIGMDYISYGLYSHGLCKLWFRDSLEVLLCDCAEASIDTSGD